MPTIVVVDEHAPGDHVNLGLLRRHGLAVVETRSPAHAFALITDRGADLMLIEVAGDAPEGVALIRDLRRWSDLPVIVVATTSEHTLQISALEAGADDYVVAPTDVDELAARIGAVLRRSEAGARTLGVLTFGDVVVDLRRRLVTVGGNAVHLTDTEYRLLTTFVRNPGALLTHTMLVRSVWGGLGGDPSALRVYVRRLRRRLGEDTAAPRLIVTESGLGYRWAPEPNGSRD